MDIGKMFDDIVKPIVDKYNKENPIKCRYEISDSKLWGMVFDKGFFDVSISYFISPGLDKPIVKKHPIGEDNQTEIVRGIKALKFNKFELDLLGIKKDWIDNKSAVKHIFKYQVILDGVPFIEIKESVKNNIKVTDEVKKDFSKKIEEVKDGKS